MHLLHDLRIARESAGVEMLHLAGQLRDFLCGLRIALDHLTQPAQLAHALLEGALTVFGIVGRADGRRLRTTGRGIAIVARVDVVPHSAIGAAPTIASITTQRALLLISEVAAQL